jgi:TPP-dependent indolepyruvate ferredoxin oxidoreductase alpha subunit
VVRKEALAVLLARQQCSQQGEIRERAVVMLRDCEYKVEIPICTGYSQTNTTSPALLILVQRNKHTRLHHWRASSSYPRRG